HPTGHHPPTAPHTHPTRRTHAAHAVRMVAASFGTLSRLRFRADRTLLHVDRVPATGLAHGPHHGLEHSTHSTSHHPHSSGRHPHHAAHRSLPGFVEKLLRLFELPARLFNGAWLSGPNRLLLHHFVELLNAITVRPVSCQSS